MSIFSKTGLIVDITSNIYTNVQRLIKGNTVKARLLNIVDSTFIRVIDTAANFTSNNPVLANGEIGVESDSLTSHPKFKIGDGTTSWNSLPYANSGSSNVNYIADTAANLTANNPIMPDGYFGIESDSLLTTPKFKIAASSTAWNDLPYANSSTLTQVLATGNTMSTGQYITDPTGYMILAHDTSAVAHGGLKASLLWFEPAMGAYYSGFRANGAHVVIRFTPTSGTNYFSGYMEFTSDNGLEIQNDGLITLKAPNVKIIQSDDVTELLNIDRASDIFSVAATINLLSKLGVSALNINDTVASLYFDNGTKVGNVSADNASTTISHTDLVNIDAASVKKNGVEIATENYVDNLITGLNWKKSVLYSTNVGENLSLTGLTAILDGSSRTLLSTDRILVKNQTTQSQNGIYNPSSGAWTRVVDADTGTKLEAATVYVREGSGEKDRVYAVNVSPITLGSTSITFALISGAGAYTYGSYLKLTGNVFDIDFTTFSTTQISEGTNKYLSNSNFGSLVNSASAATPNDSDLVATVESSVVKKITWTNVKAFFKTYFDTIYRSIVDVFATTLTSLPDTITLAQANSWLRVNIASNGNLTIPPNSSVAIPIGSYYYIRQSGTGTITLVPGSGVTLNAPSGVLSTGSQYDVIRITKQATDSWMVEVGAASWHNAITIPALATKSDNLLVKINVAIAHTGTTSETILYTSSLITGFQANDFIKFQASLNATNNANNKQFKVYVNSTANLSGSPVQLGILQFAGSSQGGIAFVRNMWFKNSLSAQSIFSTTTSTTNDEILTTGTSDSNLTFDYTNGCYFIITGILPGSSSDTLTVKWFRIQRFR